MKRLLAAVAMNLLFVSLGWGGGFEARPGTPAPALQAQDLQGQGLTLDAYRGKVVLLNFWATWCPPCQKEMPSLDRLRRKMADKPLAILALDSAEPPDDVKAFVSRTKPGFKILLDPEGVNTRRWKVFALPTSFLLDADGRVRYVLTGPTEWDEGEAVRVIEAMLAPQPASQK